MYSQSYNIIASWWLGLGIGEIYVSVCKFSSPLLSLKRSYIKKINHSPDVVTLNETFTKKGYKYNMPHYTAVTRNREHRKGEGVAILLRQDLAFTEIDADQNNG